MQCTLLFVNTVLFNVSLATVVPTSSACSTVVLNLKYTTVYLYRIISKMLLLNMTGLVILSIFRIFEFSRKSHLKFYGTHPTDTKSRKIVI